MTQPLQIAPVTYTPGPWKWRATGDDWVVIGRPNWPCRLYEVKGEWEVARLDDLMGDEPAEVEANARLIAAAPELVEAGQALLRELVWVNEQLDLMPDEYAEAQARFSAAITKATGGAA